MVDLPREYKSLMAFQLSEGLPAATVLKHIGRLIDLAADLDKPDGARRRIAPAEAFLGHNPKPSVAAVLHYFLANAWAHLEAHARRGSDAVWDWEQPEIEHQLAHLRRALSNDGYKRLPSIRRCQMATNFGNVLSRVGRFVDAVEYWDRALAIDPCFGMALANRGYGLIYYGRALYDEGHRGLFLRYAHISLSQGLSVGVDASAKSVFEEQKAAIEQRLSALICPAWRPARRCASRESRTAARESSRR